MDRTRAFSPALPWPHCWADRMDSPRVTPVTVIRNRLTVEVVAPTAARDSSPSAFPTIKASAQL